MSNDPLRSLRVATPCRVSWEGMTGDARVRFCHECSLRVYNFSELRAEEARALVTRTEGRVCGRLYRPADGSVITRDCPVGLRAARRRVARVAGASLAAIISLFTFAGGQTKARKEKACTVVQGLTLKRAPSRATSGSFAGLVLDPNGAVIVGATLTLTNERTKEKLSLSATEEGTFSFPIPATDDYTFEVASPGFKTSRTRHLRLSANEAARAEVVMQVNADSMEMGVIVIYDPPFNGSGNGTTIFSTKEITSLPHG
ncbi:MAG: carboxypeptidase-like regulatory domain-containing protein [Pyrinomonadaceae bacterium]